PARHVSDYMLSIRHLPSSLRMLPCPPGATLFPYTTLFRSFDVQALGRQSERHADVAREPQDLQKDVVPLAQLVGPAVYLEEEVEDRKSTRLNSSHVKSSYAVFCLKQKILHLPSWHRPRRRP